jgi:hypothetical protein
MNPNPGRAERKASWHRQAVQTLENQESRAQFGSRWRAANYWIWSQIGMGDYSKRIKRLLREYATEAYERELQRELAKLDMSFSEWRNGNIGSGEMSYRIHQYEKGPSRKLYKKYNHGKDAFNVAYAIVTGILERETIPPELISALEKEINFYQMLKATGDLKEPDENGN